LSANTGPLRATINATLNERKNIETSVETIPTQIAVLGQRFTGGRQQDKVFPVAKDEVENNLQLRVQAITAKLAAPPAR
jgi:hypothetical protein